MKKALCIFSCILTFYGIGQQTVNKWSVGASIGGHDGFAPTTTWTKIYQIHHYRLNSRVMLNNRFGLMLDAGYDFIDPLTSGPENVHMIRLSINAVMNTGDILKFNEIHERLGLLTHFGGGYSGMWCPAFALENPSDPGLSGVDDMVNWIIGFTPQLKLSEKFSLNGDVSMIVHHRQDYTFDFHAYNEQNEIDGYFFNWSIGLNYYIGKGTRHQDWNPTFSKSNSKI